MQPPTGTGYHGSTDSSPFVTAKECKLKQELIHEKLNNIHESVKTIKTNDLVHMDEKIEKIQGRQFQVLIGVVIAAVGTVVSTLTLLFH